MQIQGGILDQLHETVYWANTVTVAVLVKDHLCSRQWEARARWTRAML